MGHVYPRCYCLSQCIVSGHTDMQFTWQRVIMPFLAEAWPVIFTHLEAVWSPLLALTVLEISTGHTT